MTTETLAKNETLAETLAETLITTETLTETLAKIETLAETLAKTETLAETLPNSETLAETLPTFKTLAETFSRNGAPDNPETRTGDPKITTVPLRTGSTAPPKSLEVVNNRTAGRPRSKTTEHPRAFGMTPHEA